MHLRAVARASFDFIRLVKPDACFVSNKLSHEYRRIIEIIDELTQQIPSDNGSQISFFFKE